MNTIISMILIGVTAFVNLQIGLYYGRKKQHDYTLEKCLKYANGYPATGWCKFFVGDLNPKDEDR